MTEEQIKKLLVTGDFPENKGAPRLVETHISWVILSDQFAYKIKKPIQYSFLDFSSLEKRKYYCEKEIQLNRRLTQDIYIDVLPIRERSGLFSIGGGSGDLVDFTVRMNKMDEDKQMNILLLNGKVTPTDILSLAKKIANFHEHTEVVHQKDILEIRDKFNDLGEERDYLSEYLNRGCYATICRAIDASDLFIKKNKSYLTARLDAGFFRDCHGDLHTRNIFLLPYPQAFDCVEFNDDFRQIDVLNEIAFLCMDLDAFGREDLSELFLFHYNELFNSLKTEEDFKLFVYYKSYRSNIRAKVNSLRAKSAQNRTERIAALSETDKYLRLMNNYLKLL